MYRIGIFSKMVDIPVRTLRYYDECNILKPSEIDKFTGYRYYNEDDIMKCKMIKLLKYLDFTLEEINRYKDCLDENIINKKREEIKEKLKILKLKYQKLTIMLYEIQNNKQSINKNENYQKNINKKLKKN